jgi:isopentenyl diphosphate isomerase/L-lactate dehydrogenase-like FMN-dependent dehydrogenase
MFEGGVGAGTTARRNVAAFEELCFSPRVARFHPRRDISTTLFGHHVSMPVVLSSIGALGLGHRDAEPGVARAAGRNGLIQFVSGATLTSIEEITAAASGPIFYQLYYFGGRDASEGIIRRARNAGCAGLVLTVDAPVPPPMSREISPHLRHFLPREINFSNVVRFFPQALRRPAWTLDFIRSGCNLSVAMALGQDGHPLTLSKAFPLMYQGMPQWDDVAWIRDRWHGKLIIKGILAREDAERAVSLGVDGIVVSNHGGNSLDGSVPTINVLPEIVAAVGGRFDVLLDGGVRRGTDVVKALALGAKGVGLGRAYVYPFLAAGEAGVQRILEIFREDIDRTVALLGSASITELTPNHLVPAHDWDGRGLRSRYSGASFERAP